MARQDKNEDWGPGERAAMARIRSARSRARSCQDACDDATEMLKRFGKSMFEMVERGEIGSRHSDDGKNYPQMRLLYWGEIESGGLSMIAIEVDFGHGQSARVGAWARWRALWDCPSMPVRERWDAWRLSSSIGTPRHEEKVWLRLSASLRALSREIEPELDFSDFSDFSDFDELDVRIGGEPDLLGAWAGARSEQPMLVHQAPLDREPSEAEWAELEIEARAILECVKRSIDEGARAPRPPADPNPGP